MSNREGNKRGAPRALKNIHMRITMCIECVCEMGRKQSRKCMSYTFSSWVPVEAVCHSILYLRMKLRIVAGLETTVPMIKYKNALKYN